MRSWARRFDSAIQRLRDGQVLFEILVEIHVVAGQHHRSRRRVHADELRSVGVLAADVSGDAGQNFLRVAVHQRDAALGVQLHQADNVIGIGGSAAMAVPGFAGVIFQLVFLNPDFRLGKKIEAVGVVPVDVTDDQVRDLVGFDARARDGIGRLGVIGGMPLAHELVAVEAGIDQDVVASAFHQPDHHGDVHLARGVGAGDESADREILERGVADRVDFVLWRRFIFRLCRERHIEYRGK